MKAAATIFLLWAWVCLAGCGDEDPVATSGTVGGSIHVVFKWSGDELATLQELEIRDRLARAIEERGIGTVTRVGTGMGTMEIVVEMAQREGENRDKARSEIEAIARAIAPGMSAQIR